MTSLQRQVKDLKIGVKKRRQDFDPEDEEVAQRFSSDQESDGEISEDVNLGKEHYEAVSKSRLRKPQKTKLDEKKYGGQAVSRDSIFQNDDTDVLAPEEDVDEDPFAAPDEDASESESGGEDEEDDLLVGADVDGHLDEDESLDSDEAFEDGEEDKFRSKGFVFRGSGKGLEILPASSSEGEGSEQNSLDGSDVSEEEQSDIDMDDVLDNSEDGDEDEIDEGESDESSDDESTARPRPSTIKQVGTTDRERLKALISDDTAALASSLSASLSADAQKGAAVKKQYQTFDRLLDARIKLQKGLTASNDVQLDTSLPDEDAKLALQRAEEAALKLYTTIESLRQSIVEANAPSTTTPEAQPAKKRKRSTPPTSSTTTSELWSRITTLESSSLPTRRQTLDKWSSKTRTAAPITSASKLNGTSTNSQTESKLTSVLDAYLLSETPKLLSSFPNSKPPFGHTYDDTNFYQSLLRDLINSRSISTSSTSLTVPVVPLKLHPSGNTSRSSAGKAIDTKASKGRKIRYTVHEKLEHFMAGEGRGNSVGQWNDGAVREFFGSLLGQRGMLGEEDEERMSVDGRTNGGEGREVEALRLFSST